MPQVIHREAFDKMCDMLNKVHQVRRIQWDLRIQAVRWAYGTICKTLTMKTIPSRRNEVRTVISQENVKMNPHVIAPIGVILREG